MEWRPHRNQITIHRDRMSEPVRRGKRTGDGTQQLTADGVEYVNAAGIGRNRVIAIRTDHYEIAHRRDGTAKIVLDPWSGIRELLHEGIVRKRMRTAHKRRPAVGGECLQPREL